MAAAAGALTAWDVFLDPRMAREGYWTWDGPARYEGIPASNYAGLAGDGRCACSRCGRALDGDDDAATPRRRRARALRLDAGPARRSRNVLFWGRPRVAVAGGAGDGRVRGPAPCARAWRGGR